MEIMNKSKACGGHALRITVGIMVLGLLFAGSANAGNFTVCPGGCAYSSIQKAINASSNGDTILVKSGTYFENVKVKKKLNLRGIGNPVVDAGGNGSAITLSANGITLEGFTATGGGSYPNAGIKVISNNNKLSSNNANSNNYYGIVLDESSNNTLTGNNASNNYVGIRLYDASNNTLSGNNVSNNGYYYGSGIYLYDASNNTLTGNNASSNHENGIYLKYSSNNMLSSNNVSSNNRKGIYLKYSIKNTLTGNNVSNNVGGIYLYDASNNTLTGNNASNNVLGIGLSSSSNNTLTGNNANSNNWKGIFLDSSSNNKIYNNIFNNANNFDLSDSNINTWNTTRKSDTNIIGGSFLGGNFWANPNGNDFSQTCADKDKNGICDSKYKLASKNVDHLPLAMKLPT